MANPETYPHWRMPAVDSLLVSGALSRADDTDLVNLMHAGRNAAAKLNHALNLAELITFTNPVLASRFAAAPIKPDSVVALVRAAHDQLVAAVSAHLPRTPRPQLPMDP